MVKGTAPLQNDALHIPEPNRFLCSDFSMLSGCSASTLPSLVLTLRVSHS